MFNGPSHHEDGSLNSFLIEIFFFSWNIVWSHDSDFLSSGDRSGEDSSEGEKSGFIGGWHHLGDVHDQWSFRVTFSDGLSDWIVLWSGI